MIGILAALTRGTVVAAVLLSRPRAMSRFVVVAIARVTLGTASAGSPVSSIAEQVIVLPRMPPALLIKSAAAKQGADSSLPNCAAGPVKGAITPAVILPDCVGTDDEEDGLLLPQAATRAVAPTRADTRQVLWEPMGKPPCEGHAVPAVSCPHRPPYRGEQYHNGRSRQVQGPPACARHGAASRLETGEGDAMIDDGFEIKFLPGTPPQEVGCPPLSPRTERVDGMIIEYDTAVRMRDGIEIDADVFRPDSPEPVPPIIGWGPYGKHGAVKYDIFPKHGVDPAWTSKYAGFEAPDPLYWTRHGYAVINVDPRGMWNSQGDATFYSSQEARDVYDFIEWAGTQPWSNGKVGMSGVSYLAITQWGAAADRPPHLAAINPWEGVSDRYRDMSYHGGIPEDNFGPMWRSKRVAYSNGMVENTVAMHADHPLFDAYWESKTPDLSKVEIPAFVVASWSDQGLHNRGTIEGYKHISSKDKWLLVHGRKKWQFYYRPDNVELLRQFFDKFLRGVDDSGVDAWPRVRLEAREQFYVGDYC